MSYRCMPTKKHEVHKMGGLSHGNISMETLQTSIVNAINHLKNVQMNSRYTNLSKRNFI